MPTAADKLNEFASLPTPYLPELVRLWASPCVHEALEKQELTRHVRELRATTIFWCEFLDMKIEELVQEAVAQDHGFASDDDVRELVPRPLGDVSPGHRRLAQQVTSYTAYGADVPSPRPDDE